MPRVSEQTRSRFRDLGVSDRSPACRLSGAQRFRPALIDVDHSKLHIYSYETNNDLGEHKYIRIGQPRKILHVESYWEMANTLRRAYSLPTACSKSVPRLSPQARSTTDLGVSGGSHLTLLTRLNVEPALYWDQVLSGHLSPPLSLAL